MRTITLFSASRASQALRLGRSGITMAHLGESGNGITPCAERSGKSDDIIAFLRCGESGNSMTSGATRSSKSSNGITPSALRSGRSVMASEAPRHSDGASLVPSSRTKYVVGELREDFAPIWRSLLFSCCEWCTTLIAVVESVRIERVSGL